MPFTRLPSAYDTAKPKAVPPALQNSAAVQEELTAELARMAAQLRRNAEHFRKKLEEERPLVDGAAEKLDTNLGQLEGTRVRLRDRGKEARGTTFLTLGAIVGVLVAFVAMVLVIRVT